MWLIMPVLIKTGRKGTGVEEGLDVSVVRFVFIVLMFDDFNDCNYL